jgi:hypothetical protein
MQPYKYEHHQLRRVITESTYKGTAKYIHSSSSLFPMSKSIPICVQKEVSIDGVVVQMYPRSSFPESLAQVNGHRWACRDRDKQAPRLRTAVCAHKIVPFFKDG